MNGTRPANGVRSAKLALINNFRESNTSTRERPVPTYHESTNTPLHLPSLSIGNFRGIDNLEIPRLGRVTLIAGQNGVGKTTVLEAVRVYAARGHLRVLEELLHQREEFIDVFNEDDGPELIPDLTALFHERDPTRVLTISIGPSDHYAMLAIELLSPSTWTKEQPELFPNLNIDDGVWMLKIRFRNKELALPWVGIDQFQNAQAWHRNPQRTWSRWLTEDWPEPIRCQTFGPGLSSTQDLTGLWSNVALTDDEDRTTEALRLLHNGIERVAIVAPTQRTRRNQRVLVKVVGRERPVPLKSLGDGVVRVFAVALALANSKNGFLVIDEAENGIHHSAQRNFWNMVLRTAQRNNVQVLATTHSWDCVTGFAQASSAFNDVEGILVRLEDHPDGTRAVEYSEADLMVAAEQRIEVR